jgi:hypothetical protein
MKRIVVIGLLLISLETAVPASAQWGALDSAMKMKKAADTVEKAKEVADAAEKAKQVVDAAEKAKQVMDAAEKLKQAADMANKAKEAADMANKAKQVQDLGVRAKEIQPERVNPIGAARGITPKLDERGVIPQHLATRYALRPEPRPLHDVMRLGGGPNHYRQMWALRGGYHGYVVPPNVFQSYLGGGFPFRPSFMVVGNYACLNAGIASFVLADPVPVDWSANWYESSNVTVSEGVGGGYMMTNVAFPGVTLSLAASPVSCAHLGVGFSLSPGGSIREDSETDQPQDQDQDQNPQASISQGPADSFAAEGPADSSGSQAEVTYWLAIKDSTNPQDFRDYLDSFPHGAFFLLAQKRLGAFTQPASAPAQN